MQALVSILAVLSACQQQTIHAPEQGPANPPETIDLGDPETANRGSDEISPATRHTLEVDVQIDPPPESSGGNVFLTGFRDVHPRTRLPMPGVSPQDHHTLEMFVHRWPVQAKVELIEGLHYFVMYGFQQWPGPGDRMSEFQQITQSAESPLQFSIGTMTIPGKTIRWGL